MGSTVSATEFSFLSDIHSCGCFVICAVAAKKNGSPAERHYRAAASILNFRARLANRCKVFPVYALLFYVHAQLRKGWAQPSSRSDDEGDCGRGRSEAKPNGVPPMAAPCERNTKKEGDCQSFDFLVTLLHQYFVKNLTII